MLRPGFLRRNFLRLPENRLFVLQLYLDTSVYGGVFDQEFEIESRRIMAAVESKQCLVLVSEIVLDELAKAPDPVQRLFHSLPKDQLISLSLTEEVRRLQSEYLNRKILTHRSRGDAAHVAFATIARADAIVSWNFRDIVRLDKMKLYNQVNFSLGYGILQIVSPKEVYFDE
jgi:predicted nucleic acid-binding protein